MSKQSFEKKIGEWLHELDPCYAYHPPDVRMAKIGVPADFVVCSWGFFSAIECKSVESGNFPLSGWTPHQRQVANQIISAGGQYHLFVEFRDRRVAKAWKVDHRWIPLHGSLSPDDANGVPLTKAALEEIL